MCWVSTRWWPWVPAGAGDTWRAVSGAGGGRLLSGRGGGGHRLGVRECWRSGEGFRVLGS